MDLRHEENIDAFSMNGTYGRQSPTVFKMDHEDNGKILIRIFQKNFVEINEENQITTNMNLDTVINWKKIVQMYYKMTGKRIPNKDDEEENKFLINR